jgi:hypothetical protein
VPAEGTPRRSTGEFWRFPVPDLYPFFVPYDESECIDGWALIRLCDDIRTVVDQHS